MVICVRFNVLPNYLTSRNTRFSQPFLLSSEYPVNSQKRCYQLYWTKQFPWVRYSVWPLIVVFLNDKWRHKNARMDTKQELHHNPRHILNNSSCYRVLNPRKYGLPRADCNPEISILLANPRIQIRCVEANFKSNNPTWNPRRDFEIQKCYMYL